MSWNRQDHKTQAAVQSFGNGLAVIDIGPKSAIVRPPVPEQDARQLARRQRNRAQVFAQREVLEALRFAQEAIEPKETALERAMRWLREWRGSL